MAPDVHGKVTMESVFAFIFWASILITLYAYSGYPLLLAIAAAIRTKKVRKGPFTPTVTLIISVYNEERVIREKIENSLALDYPREKLEIIVASDGSTDRTHEIVRQFMPQGVRLHVLEGRLGKTAVLNSVVPLLKSGIVLFTDANSMYDKDAVKYLMENFADPEVGCVTGETRLMNPEGSSLGENEKAYYSYDTYLKIKESDTGSTVGADGAIFAIRRELYQPLGQSIINDFVIPLQVVARGYRVVYEPRAFLYEATATPLKGGFKRRIRIINRSLWGLFSVSGVLNPLKTGFFSVEVISRKLLRWTAPVFILTALLANIGLLHSPFYLLTFVLQAAFYLMAGLTALNIWRTENRFLNFPFYFCHGNAAALIAIFKFLRGERIVVWDPLRR